MPTEPKLYDLEADFEDLWTEIEAREIMAGRLFRTGVTARPFRKLSIIRDCCVVSLTTCSEG